jgi:hypothetical protein
LCCRAPWCGAEIYLLDGFDIDEGIGVFADPFQRC